MLSRYLLVSTNLVCLSRGYVNCVAFKPDNPNIVVSGSYDETIKTWDITSGSCLSTLKVDNSVNSITYSPDGSKLAAAHYKTVSIFNMETNEVLCTLRGHTDPVMSVCFSPCGEKIASGGGCAYGNKDYSIRIWDAKTGEQIGSPLSVDGKVTSVCFSSDGKKLTSGSEDSTVRNWDPATRASLS